MGEPDKDSPPSAEPEKDPAPAVDIRRRYKRIFLGICVLIAAYLFSYGPAVTKAINHYGKTGPFLRALYTPAGWLAEHSDMYRDYSLYWARNSRNYPWWVQHAHLESENPLVPPNRRKGSGLFEPDPTE